MAEIEIKQLDKRVAQRYVRKGILDERDWEKHLRALPDLEEQALPLDAAMDNDDFDLDDEDEDEVDDEPGATEPGAPA
jgi:hypothetical protein